jgi:hypothetical protein
MLPVYTHSISISSSNRINNKSKLVQQEKLRFCTSFFQTEPILNIRCWGRVCLGNGFIMATVLFFLYDVITNKTQNGFPKRANVTERGS